ncbi:MAG: DUF1592 domain-containing protein [Opitutales bacterium]
MKRIVAASVVFSAILLCMLYLPAQTAEGGAWSKFIGRMHPLILHVPIGALLALFVMEFIRWVQPQSKLDRACEILIWICALSAIPTVVFGYLLASGGGYNEELLSRHSWLGWGTAILCVWLLVFRYAARGKPALIWLYRPFLFINVILLTLAGHYGGSLTHGSDYLTKYMPPELKGILGIEEKLEGAEALLAEQEASGEAVDEDLVFFANHIQPVMSQYCYDCHGPDKQNGNIRLDELDWDIVNGVDAEGWHTALDQINAGEMPPEGKAQPTDEERRTLVNWITENLEVAAIAKRGEPRNTMRRLTRAQYTNSLNELLNLSIDFGDVLPEDGKSEMGFTNAADTLQTSALHIEYYKDIARSALDKAIVTGDRPEVKRYRVDFADNSGRNKIAGKFGGFQSVSVETDDFTVSVLDEFGQPMSGPEVEGIQKMIGADLRGSARDRFAITKDGMNLYSALPHKEAAPRSWQGPSPNLKMLIKDVYPGKERFAFRVEASKGDFMASFEEGFVSLREDKRAIPNEGTIVVHGKDFTSQKHMQVNDDGWILPKDLTANASAIYELNIPKEGFYQIDLEHPYAAADAMPSFRLNFGRRFNKQERLNIPEELASQESIIRPVSLVYFKKKKYKMNVGGRFFVGFRRMAFTPIIEGTPEHEALLAESRVNEELYSDSMPAIRAYAGTRTDDGMDYETFGDSRVVDAPNGQAKIYEFIGNFENLPVPDAGSNLSGDLSNTMVLGLWNDFLVKKSSASGPPLKIHSMEIEAPYYEQWPPKSHTEIFFDSPKIGNEEAYTAEVLGTFIEKAFRRNIAQEELELYMSFWRAVRPDYEIYEESVKEVMVAVLCSPNFLYLVNPESVDGNERYDQNLLASRLSYFLWNAPPDEELLALAETGKLLENIDEQVDRMVEDEKTYEMVQAFARDWLRVDRLEQMDTNVEDYPDFTRFVKEDLAKETYHFINEVLREDMSIMKLIDSEFTMLNQNLAEFYGIDGVEGSHFQRVDLPGNSLRGGLLTQGAFLNGHSDGIQSHPIKRAVWLKEKILGEPPPPAPPNVPELDPDTPGFEKLTLKEQLELHRNKASCVDCHLKIDPYGVVFENFDASGRFVTEFKGKPVDAKSQLPDGTEVEGVSGIKQYILEQRQDSFAKSLVEHMYAYALGRNVSFADEAEIDGIVALVRQDGYRFKSVIEHIVSSDSFTQP